MPKVLNFRVIIEQDEDGVFVASVPALQGCYTEGDTYEEVMKNIKDVISLHVDSRRTRGEAVDDTRVGFIGVTNVAIPYGISSNYPTGKTR